MAQTQQIQFPPLEQYHQASNSQGRPQVLYRYGGRGRWYGSIATAQWQWQRRAA